MKNISFLSENFQFLEMKFSIYWNRCVFVRLPVPVISDPVLANVFLEPIFSILLPLFSFFLVENPCSS